MLFSAHISTFWDRHSRARAQKCVMPARVCKDLYEIFYGSSLVSYKLKFQISWRSELWLRRYLQNNNDVCLTFLRTFTTKRACTGLRLVCARACRDLYETYCGSFLVSYKLKFQISWTSKLWLRRYLQNNNDFCLTFLRTFMTKRARTGLRLVCACVCMDLHEIWNLKPIRY